MRLIERPFGAAALFAQVRYDDERGFFTRTFCREVLAAHGIELEIAQANLSFSRARHTLRGLHLQRGRSAEIKIVQCPQGALFDVIVDLRPESPTFCQWQGFELSAENGRVLVVPRGFAHGFLSLTEEVQLAYLVSAAYDPAAECGFRFDDPAFRIAWPAAPQVISAKDLGHAPFTPALLAAA